MKNNDSAIKRFQGQINVEADTPKTGPKKQAKVMKKSKKKKSSY